MRTLKTLLSLSLALFASAPVHAQAPATATGVQMQQRRGTLAQMPQLAPGVIYIASIGNGNYQLWVGTADGNKQLFNGIPGPKGDAGPVGPQGVQGPKGDTGTQGLQGVPGPVGPTGGTGPQGAIGATGPQGLKGDVGAIGPKGDTGATGTTGPQGPSGVITAAAPLVYDATNKALSINSATSTTPGTLSSANFVRLTNGKLSLSKRISTDANGVYAWTFPTGFFSGAPVVNVTVEAPAGVTAPYNAHIVGAPTATGVTVQAFKANNGISLLGLSLLNIFSNPGAVTVNITATES